MDTELSRAFRTIQRAGINVTHPQMNYSELSSSYGRLLYQWLQNRGFSCHSLDMRKSKLRFNSIPQATLTRALQAFYRTQTSKEVKIEILSYLHAPGYVGAAGELPGARGYIIIDDPGASTIDLKKDSEMLMAKSLEKFNILQLQACLSNLTHAIHSHKLAKKCFVPDAGACDWPSPTSPSQPQRQQVRQFLDQTKFANIDLIFAFQEDDVASPDIKQYLSTLAFCYHEVLTDEEVKSKEEAAKKKAEKAAKAAESKRKKEEAEEKELLRQLKAKWESD